MALASEGLSWVRIEKSLDCEAVFLPVQKCIATGAMDFSPNETRTLRKKLAALEELYPQFFLKLLENRKELSFYRHESGAQKISSKMFKKNLLIGAWVSQRDMGVHLTDRFFKTDFRINEKHDYMDYILIHELSHVLDLQMESVSATPEFVQLYQWERVSGGEPVNISGVTFQTKRWQTMGVPFAELDKVREASAQLARQGKGAEAEAISLSFGQSHGHPGSYSMLNPSENFAEIVVGYFLDPKTLRTAPLVVHDWLTDFFSAPEIDE